MKILVLGGGLMGVTTAHALVRDGHEVTVVDKAPGAAEATSFANAGLVAPSHAHSWAEPAAPLMLLKSLTDRNAAIRLTPRIDPALWGWCVCFLGQCTAERFRANSLVKYRLGRYSQERLRAVTEETGIAYDGVRKGLLYLYGTRKTLDHGVEGAKLFQQAGLEFEVLDSDGAVAREPALGPARDRIAGALYCPTDESGDARLFTRALADVTARQGVIFLWGRTVTGLTMDGGRVTGAMTDAGPVTADATVLALGPWSPLIARTVGLRLPVYPVKGRSVTLPVNGHEAVPIVGGVQSDRFMAWARFGDRLRLTAGAIFCGYDRSHRPEDFAGLLKAGRELFPDAADWSKPTYWAGLRPMTPSGVPILGRRGPEGLWVNTGQGHMGWTLSCGSAQVTADLIAGRGPEIDPTGLIVA